MRSGNAPQLTFWHEPAAFLPQRSRDRERIDLVSRPPGPFVASLVQGPVMGATQRDSEFIADLAPQCTRLGKAQVMRVAG